MTEQTTFTREEIVSTIQQVLTDMLIAWSPSDGEFLHLFDDLGLDSLDGYDMVALIEQRFELDAGPEDFARTLTVHTVVEAISEKLAASGRLRA